MNLKKKSKINSKKLELYLFIGSYLKNHILLLFLSFFFAVLIVGFSLYLPILIGRAIDSMIHTPGITGILPLLIRILSITILTSCLQYFSGYFNHKLSYLTARDMREDAFDQLQVLSIRYTDKTSTGDLLNRLTSDIEQISDGLLLGFSQFFTSIVTIIGTFIFMLFLSPFITFLVVLLTPLSLFIASFIAKRSFKLFRKQASIKGKLTNCVEESMYGLKTIQAYENQEKWMAELKHWNESLQKTSQSVTFISSLSNPATRFVNGLIYTVVAVGGAYFVLQGMITVGSLTAFLSYASQYTKPFNEITSVFTELQNALSSTKRVYELLETDEIEGIDGIKGIKGIDEIEKIEEDFLYENTLNRKGEVMFDNVSFSYTKEVTLIKDLNLLVKKGQSVAIVGPTGAGKSTLINLLMRFYDCDQGRILLDGHDTILFNRTTLRRHYGMVLQDTWLKSGTIFENIAYGKTDATIEEVMLAAKRARADQFIEKLPSGYETMISERAGNLSSGQKQLLCIARVMLGNPPMLILDEATSSIDARTEILVQKTFIEMMEGHTSFVVAHRLSTIRHADVILVMKDGKIVEQGNHEDLILTHGFYHQLYQAQYQS